jgi:hypothetical protein
MVKKYSRVFPVLIVMGALLAGVVWLAAGRLSLFQSSSYMSAFASDKALELYHANVLWFAAGTNVKQSFTAVYPGLAEVSILWARQEEMAQNTTMTFKLKESCDALDSLRQVVIPLSEIENDKFYSFTFTPIDGSTGQTYCFILQPDPTLIEKNIGVWASGYDVYAEGSAFYQAPSDPIPSTPIADEQATMAIQKNGGEYKVFLPLVLAGKPAGLPPAFDTGFQLHYKGRPIDTFFIFMDRLVSHKSYFWGTKAFYVLLVGFYIAGIFFLARVRSD